MRMKLALLLCVLAAACASQNPPGDSRLRQGNGHGSQGQSACTIVVAVDDRSMVANEAAVQCSKSAEVVFVFVNYGAATHNLTISKTMDDKDDIDPGTGKPRRKDVLLNDITSGAVASQGWTVASQKMNPDNAVQNHKVKYTVHCAEFPNNPLDPDIEIMM